MPHRRENADGRESSRPPLPTTIRNGCPQCKSPRLGSIFSDYVSSRQMYHALVCFNCDYRFGVPDGAAADLHVEAPW